jgi:1-deoxy-D-xylulose-5-phosphate reductoisomerase
VKPEPRGVAVLGSTGSIGTNTLDVVRRLGPSHRIVALAAGRNGAALLEQIREFRPRLASLEDARAAEEIREAAAAVGTEIRAGEAGAVAVATHPEAQLVVSGIVGAAGVVPTHAAVEAGRTVALANKEVLVVAGEPVTRAAARAGAVLIPVDSEHSALHQCLRSGRREEVRRIILTASGGPFWEREAARFSEITVADALAHPVWNMGSKITIDSATLMNKGLEVIEARWLFDLPPERIEILVHPGSIVHSLVEFVDGSIVAQLGTPDMRHPIQYALTYPDRRRLDLPPLDLAALPPLRFHRPDGERFPCPRLAYRALALGGTIPAVLNGANEELVAAFLEGAIPFQDIPRHLSDVLEEAVLERAPGAAPQEPGIRECLEADAWGRRRIRERIGALHAATPRLGPA